MFGGAKSWKDRKIADKPCRRCAVLFKPTCGGNLFCSRCIAVQKREAHAKGARMWRSKNRERVRRTNATHALKSFGMSLEDYETLLNAQNGKCAICEQAPDHGRGVIRKLAVDHCHVTGKVRGLLCSNCNTALGLFRDDMKRLRAAVKYLAFEETSFVKQ